VLRKSQLDPRTLMRVVRDAIAETQS
jgi:hypothetical protein